LIAARALAAALFLAACSRDQTPTAPSAGPDFASGQTVLTVTRLADNGAGSFRAALAAVAAGGKITFADNLCAVAGSCSILTESELVITRDVTINGPTPYSLSLDGQASHRVLRISSGTVTIKNLTITGGNGLAGGDFFDGEGGGIFNVGTLTFTNSTVIGNSASDRGGAIFNYTAGVLTLRNSTVSGNRANRAGGIANYGGTVILTDSWVSQNHALGIAGGIDNDGNNNDNTMTLTNSTVSDNDAHGFGGGINNNRGTMTVANSSVSGNTVTADDGGNAQGGGIANFATLTLGKSRVCQNTPDDLYNGGTLTKDNKSTVCVLRP
jgi:hypothetical protein